MQGKVGEWGREHMQVEQRREGTHGEEKEWKKLWENKLYVSCMEKGGGRV